VGAGCVGLQAANMSVATDTTTLASTLCVAQAGRTRRRGMNIMSHGTADVPRQVRCVQALR
jgi:hypothetical protein